MENAKGANTDQVTNIMIDGTIPRSKSSANLGESKFRRQVVKMQTTAAVTKMFAEAGNAKSRQHWKLLVH